MPAWGWWLLLGWAAASSLLTVAIARWFRWLRDHE